jgi:hypothetical protein
MYAACDVLERTVGVGVASDRRWSGVRRAYLVTETPRVADNGDRCPGPPAMNTLHTEGGRSCMHLYLYTH